MSLPSTRPRAAIDGTGYAPTLSGVAERLRALADVCDPQPAPLVIGEKTEARAPAGDDIVRCIRAYLSARRRRDEIFGPGWFADPAWDLLLDLAASQHEGKQISISSACIAAAVPPTTALRWISMLVAEGAILRVDDARDRRRAYLELAPEMGAKIEAWVMSSLPTIDSGHD